MKRITIELDVHISELKRCIENEEFIPNELGENVAEKFSEIDTKQKELRNQFDLLAIVLDGTLWETQTAL